MHPRPPHIQGLIDWGGSGGIPRVSPYTRELRGRINQGWLRGALRNVRGGSGGIPRVWPSTTNSGRLPPGTCPLSMPCIQSLVPEDPMVLVVLVDLLSLRLLTNRDYSQTSLWTYSQTSIQAGRPYRAGRVGRLTFIAPADQKGLQFKSLRTWALHGRCLYFLLLHLNSYLYFCTVDCFCYYSVYLDDPSDYQAPWP